MAVLKAGMAERTMNVPVGMDLTGFLARTGPAEGIHDEPKIKSLVLDDGATKLVLIVCDLLGLQKDYTDSIRAMVGNAVGISGNNVVVACTHTHSGPASMHLRGCGNAVPAWLEYLRPAVVECAEAACSDMGPAELSYGIGRSDIGFNRILRDCTEQYRDPQVGVLKISRKDTEDKDIVMVNYGCHPVVLGAENLLYTRDYPFYLEKALKGMMGGNTSVIFTNCCCGDQNPVERDSFEIAEKLGTKLAESVTGASAVFDAGDFENASISIKASDVEIPMSFPYEREHFEKLLYEFEANLADIAAKDPHSMMVKAYTTFIGWARDILDRMDKGTLARSVSARVVKIQIGPLTLVTLPFEVFHGIGLRIKQYFGLENTIVLGYANGNHGYLPSKKLYEKAGYETGMAYRYYGYPGPVVREAEDIIFNSIK